LPHIDTDKLKKDVKRWADEIGMRNAQFKICRQGLSWSLAYQLTTGKYVSEPKEKVIEALQKAMAK
jgi:hypothetical protein